MQANMRKIKKEVEEKMETERERIERQGGRGKKLIRKLWKRWRLQWRRRGDKIKKVVVERMETDRE